MNKRQLYSLQNEEEKVYKRERSELRVSLKKIMSLSCIGLLFIYGDFIIM